MGRSLVIGGGFLGCHVAQAAARRGDAVTVFSRSFNEWLLQDDRSGEGRIELVEGAVPPGTGLAELIDDSDVVYYLAGSGTPAGASDDPGGSILSSVVPAAAVLDIMRTTGTRRVVIASSGGTVYGRPRHLPTPESDPTDPISLHGHNALSIERYARFYADHHGLEPVLLRYANPYGPGQLVRRGQGVIAAWCEAVARGEPLVVYGSLATRRDFLYVDDAAEATVLAGQPGVPSDVYNVGSGRSVALEDILTLIEQHAGRAAAVEHIEARGVDVPVTHLDCARLESVTGWTARTDLASGIARTFAWISHRAYPWRGSTSPP